MEQARKKKIPEKMHPDRVALRVLSGVLCLQDKGKNKGYASCAGTSKKPSTSPFTSRQRRVLLGTENASRLSLPRSRGLSVKPPMPLPARVHGLRLPVVVGNSNVCLLPFRHRALEAPVSEAPPRGRRPGPAEHGSAADSEIARDHSGSESHCQGTEAKALGHGKDGRPAASGVRPVMGALEPVRRAGIMGKHSPSDRVTKAWFVATIVASPFLTMTLSGQPLIRELPGGGEEDFGSIFTRSICVRNVKRPGTEQSPLLSSLLWECSYCSVALARWEACLIGTNP
jgi:hypothetical protein